MTILYNTGTALNIVYLSYHDLIQQRNTGIVAKYDTFDESNIFDPINLYGIIIDSIEYDVSKYGVLSDIIEYRIPYACSNGKLFKHTLTLGDYIYE